MEVHVHLDVPSEAETARLLTRNRRWGVYYRSVIGDIEGRLEFRQINPDMLRADQVDPADADAVIAYIELRLQAAGFDTARRPPEAEPIAASWDIQRRGAA